MLKEKGAVARGWLGVQTQPVTSAIAVSLKLPGTKGALIANPLPGGPAEVAGIRAGDVVLSVEGKAIVDARDLTLTISGNAPDTMVRVTIWRDGAATDVPVKLGALQDPVPNARTPGGNAGDNNGGNNGPERADSILLPGLGIFPNMGLSLAPAKDRTNGLEIVNILANGPAEKVGLSQGDILIAIAGSAVSSPADVAAALKTVRDRGAKVLTVQVQSGTIRVYVGIPIN
jgi:serine protease Do